MHCKGLPPKFGNEVIVGPPFESARAVTAQVPFRRGRVFVRGRRRYRPMMFLSLKDGQPNLNKFFVEMFELVRIPGTVDANLLARTVWLVHALSMIACVYLTLGAQGPSFDSA